MRVPWHGTGSLVQTISVTPAQSILFLEYLFYWNTKIHVFKTWIFDSKTEKMPLTMPLSEHETDKLHINVPKLLVLFF